MHVLSQCGTLPGGCVLLRGCSAHTHVETDTYSLPFAEVMQKFGANRFLILLIACISLALPIGSGLGVSCFEAAGCQEQGTAFGFCVTVPWMNKLSLCALGFY